MPQQPRTSLEPRKTPVQARSSASVDAILQATIQVLLAVGPERLTTTKVAARAGVSVGTLYQYFPNKSSLLRGAMKRHFDEVTEAVERVCREQRGKRLQEMGGALVNAFLAAKMRDPDASVALYSVSSDVDGQPMVKEMQRRLHLEIVALLKSASTPLTKDVHLVATMIQSAMAGASRRLLESEDPEEQFHSLRKELVLMVGMYLESSSG